MRLVGASCLVAVLAVSSTALSAQWPKRMPPDVPRNAQGEVDLDAPVPRTADGKPDFSGLWRGAPFPGGRGRGRGGARGQGGADAEQPATAPVTPPAASFLDVAANIPDGAPLTPYGRMLLDERIAGNSKDNPEAHCLPMGIVQLHTQGFPRRFIQTPRELVILYEASAERREIFTDGRPLPPLGDPQPWWYGYSAGRWEGDTLVVETNNFRDNGWLDVRGTPLTDQGKITERFRRTSYGRMEIDITIEDPKAFTKPFTVRTLQSIIPDDDIIEFICQENNRFKG